LFLKKYISESGAKTKMYKNRTVVELS